jgi:AraC-like DNA-binding protein
VRITPGELRTFFLVQIPLRGSAEITAANRSIVSTPALASVLSPDDPVDMRWGAGNPQLIVRFERAALEGRLAAMLGRPPEQPLRFALGLETGAAPVRSWLRIVALLREELERGTGLIRQPLAAGQLEQLLMTGLLLAQPSNYSAALNVGAPPASPRAVRRAIAHVHAHLGEPLTSADLAAAAGVSTRALQRGFRRQLDATPTGYVRELRLQRAHEELVAADPAEGASVAEIALRWGFMHQGRFASTYRQRYGVPPSRTLRS